MSASPRKTGAGAQRDTGLLIFVVEAASKEDTSLLLKRARKRTRESTALLGVRHGQLFALVVSTSFMVGVKHTETESSLRRFHGQVTRILKAAKCGRTIPKLVP